MKMYPKRECNDCKHVVDIEEDATGRDVIICELDRCEFCPCGNDSAPDEPDVFKPCPICGMQLKLENLAFSDEDGEFMGEMEHIIDYEDVKSPVNAMYPEERVAAELEGDTKWITECEEVYEYACNCVEYLVLGCRCGYQFCMCADDAGFPEKGWLNRFADKANRRV